MVNQLKALPTRRLLATAAVTVIIVVVAINAGFWQYGRYEDRADALRAYETAATGNVVALDSVAQPGESADTAPAVWRTAVVSGRFMDDSPIELRNRPVESTPSMQYLAWFETDAGAAILVNVGWVPAAEAGALPELGHDPVTIEMVLRDYEEDDGRRDAGATRITPAQVSPPATDAFPVYGMLQHTCEVSDCYSPAELNQVPLPYLSTGPHLSYAWQWWVFAGMAPVGAVILMRRDAEELAQAEDPANPEPKVRKSRSRRKVSDEEIEDAL